MPVAGALRAPEPEPPAPRQADARGVCVTPVFPLQPSMRALWPDGVYPLDGLGVAAHLLVWSRQAVLIDAGLVGVPGRLRRTLGRLGLGPSALRAILLTHGHLDHARGLAAIREWSGAPVYAHPAEQAHLDGTFPYRGPTRACGRLEALGRAVLGYRRVRIDVPLAEGDELPFWGGLRVVHLPGHTAGHCGFYSARERVLFSGDLFASYLLRPVYPPRFLNEDPVGVRASARRALTLPAAGMIPNHYHVRDARWHRDRLARLVARSAAVI